MLPSVEAVSSVRRSGSRNTARYTQISASVPARFLLHAAKPQQPMHISPLKQLRVPRSPLSMKLSEASRCGTE